LILNHIISSLIQYSCVLLVYILFTNISIYIYVYIEVYVTVFLCFSFFLFLVLFPFFEVLALSNYWHRFLPPIPTT